MNYTKQEQTALLTAQAGGTLMLIVASEPGMPLEYLGKWIALPLALFAISGAHMIVEQKLHDRKAKRPAAEAKKEEEPNAESDT